MLETNYSNIWDCCCDHGLLGAALLQLQPRAKVHFVDTVPEIIRQLEQQLLRFYPDQQMRYQLYCTDAGAIQLIDGPEKQLVVIAGVGGDLCAELVTRIYKNSPSSELEFLLCPVHHCYTLRQQLRNLGFSCQREILIEENRRFYEALLVQPRATESNQPLISTTGTDIWQTSSSDESTKAGIYLAKITNHYQRVVKSNNPSARTILEAYQNVEIQQSN